MKNIYKVNEEAVKKIAERVYDNGSTVINRNDLEELFPELIKSEDERIIKRELIHYFTKGTEFLSLCSVSREQILTWLEKQGEQKPTNNQFTPEQASVLDKHIDKFLEQKSAWSEKDETGLTNTIIMLKEGASLHFSKKDITKTVDWLKSLKDRIQTQSKQEWKPSDEQMEALWNVYQGGKEQAELATLYTDLKHLQ